MNIKPQKLFYEWNTSRNELMQYEIHVDYYGNIRYVSEYKYRLKDDGKQPASYSQTQQSQSDKDFESFVRKCLKSICCYHDMSDLIAALNEDMIQRYFNCTPK